MITKESSRGTNTGHATYVVALTTSYIRIEEQNYKGKYVTYRTLSLNSPIVKSAVFIHPRG